MRTFCQKQRLLSKKDFKGVFDNRYKLVGKAFTLRFATNNTKPYARLGLSISKNFVRTAVKRNSIRRIVRESFRDYRSLFPGLDIVILLSAPITGFNDHQIRRHIDYLFVKLAETLNIPVPRKAPEPKAPAFEPNFNC